MHTNGWLFIKIWNNKIQELVLIVRAMQNFWVDNGNRFTVILAISEMTYYDINKFP